MLLVILLVCVQHAVEPGKQLLGAVVRVQYHRDAICGSNGTNVVSACNGAGNGSLLIAIGGGLERGQGVISEDGKELRMKKSYLAGEVERSTLGHLQDDG